MVKLFRQRYLMFKVVCGKTLSKTEVWKAIVESFRMLLGVLGLSQANLTLIEYDEKKQVGVLRCSHKFLDAVRASLTFINQINNEKANVYSLRVSGTLKTLHEFKAKIAEKL
ncbi:ribonuclease P protein component 2 [Candidatus Bathyarchaeota archaeon]|nr:MAG: ribonuclease P protein component 2 [Candidatus Bathyarchaeota archaeon]